MGICRINTSDSELQNMFEEYGAVQSAQVIMDRDTGRSKGFGFVEMSSDQEAQAAITGLNGKEAGGRSLTVNEARPREDRGGAAGAAMAAVVVNEAVTAVVAETVIRSPLRQSPRPSYAIVLGRAIFVSSRAEATNAQAGTRGQVASWGDSLACEGRFRQGQRRFT